MTMSLLTLGLLVITIVMFIFNREMGAGRDIVYGSLLFAMAVRLEDYVFVEPWGISPDFWNVVLLLTVAAFTAMILTRVGRWLTNRRKAEGEQVS